MIKIESVPSVLLHLQSLLGILVILAAAWAMSEDRRAFPVRAVVVGLALQVGLALFVVFQRQFVASFTYSGIK